MGKRMASFTLDGVYLATHAETAAYLTTLKESCPVKSEQHKLLRVWDLNSLIRRKLRALDGSVCAGCWLLTRHCLCASLPSSIPSALCDASGSCLLLKNRLKVTLVMHKDEVKLFTPLLRRILTPARLLYARSS